MSTQPLDTLHLPRVIATAPDRMGFTLFMAVLLHMVIILGVGFELADRQAPAASLEITLAQYQSSNAPDKADYLAQANQIGSGDALQKKLQTTPIESRRTLDKVARVQPQKRSQVQPKTGGVKTLTTMAQSRPVARSADEIVRDRAPIERKISLLEKSLEIASLEAELAAQAQFSSKGPKIRTVSAASTRYSIDAYYMDGWRRKVEAIGNLNYPEQARRENMFGSLRMLVAVLPDGSIKEIRILKSSGKRLLDDAAIRIVRLSAPFSKFPNDLRAEVDILQIIRTWKFQKNQYSSGM